MRNKKNGFTLIELVIVVAIIGILSTILVPKLREQLAKAKDAKVISFLGAARTSYKILSVEKMVSNSGNSANPTVKLSEILNKLDAKSSALINPVWAGIIVGGSRKDLTSELKYNGTVHLMSGNQHNLNRIFYERNPQPVDEIMVLEPFSEYNWNNIEKYSTEGIQWNKY